MSSFLFKPTFFSSDHPGYRLSRYPDRPKELQQPWDAADELLIEFAQQLPSGSQVLIAQDSFGALTVGLHHLSPILITDSFVSKKGTEKNLSQNSVSPPVRILSPLEPSQHLPEEAFDCVLLRVPKSQSYFEDLLHRLTPHLKPEAQVVCGVMVKHQSKSSFDHLHRIIGPTHTSLASKKARLIFSTFTEKKSQSPHPKSIHLDGFSRPFLHHANLFSREKLDIGTRYFLDYLPQGQEGRILDLGCANGVVGIRAQELNPKAHILFSDDSHHAVESARANFKAHFPEQNADFLWLNCFETQPSNSLDWVLCNPPFHQENRIGDFIARQMFHDSRSALKLGGTLRIVGNRHLGYGPLLKRIFGNVCELGANSKFVVLESQKTQN